MSLEDYIKKQEEKLGKGVKNTWEGVKTEAKKVKERTEYTMDDIRS